MYRSLYSPFYKIQKDAHNFDIDTSNLWTYLLGANLHTSEPSRYYEGWNFNSGNYLFTTDTK